MKKLYLQIFIIAILLSANVNAGYKLYYFNPDGKMANPSILINKSSLYFNALSPQITLQPIIQFGPLLAMLNNNKSDLVIMPKWSYELLLSKIKIKPFLIPINSENKYTYRKVLIVKSGKVKNLADLKGKKVATTSLGEKTLALLNKIFFNKVDNFRAQDINFIFVKKDIDAILATKFGQVDAALIVPRTLESLKKTRPVMVKGLEILMHSEDILEPPLFIKGNSPKELNQIKKLFLTMDQNQAGKDFLNIIGYNKWIEYPEELK